MAAKEASSPCALTGPRVTEHDDGVCRVRGLSESSCQSDILNISAVSEDRIRSLTRMLNKHNDEVVKILLSSKESLGRRTAIESAFRACKEAFIEVSTACLGLMENNVAPPSLSEIRVVIGRSLADSKPSAVAYGVASSDDVMNLRGTTSSIEKSMRTYASVAGQCNSMVRVANGSILPTPKTTSFLIVPKDTAMDKFSSSKETKEVFQRVLKPSDYDLKVRRISSARNNGVRIEALSADLPKIRKSTALDRAGLIIK